MKSKLLNISAMFLFGTLGYFVKNTGMPSGVITMVRSITGVIILLLACLIMKRKISFVAIRKSIPLLATSGIIMGANWILLFEAYKYTTVAVATLSYYMAPVFMIIISAVLFHERLTPVRAVCVLLSVFGMTLVAGVFKLQGHGIGVLGVILGLCAGICYAIVVTLNKFVKGVDAMERTISQMVFAAVAMTVYTFITVDKSDITITRISVLFLLVIGIIHTGLAYLAYFYSLSDLSMQTLAVFSYIDPVTAIICSAILLNERVSVMQLLGAALILGSTLFCELWTGKKEKEKNDELCGKG